MRITFLGHAGCCVETGAAIIVMDPWLSPLGAFDSSWFQLPRNHHLAAFVQDKLADKTKKRYLYISHEHKDHFDVPFLSSIQARDFTILCPDYRRPYLKSFFERYECTDVVLLGDEGEAAIPDGFVKIWLDDAELNRDSAILVKTQEGSFLNLNDCRLADALPSIARSEGPIDVFTCQFSGASWHPTCYDYPPETYGAIARRKMLAKFASVLQSIRAVSPRAYFPSAGPPCFLDPTLLRINFEPMNIFPRTPQIIEFLERKLSREDVGLVELMPGDTINGAGEFDHKERLRLSGDDYPGYISEYAAWYEGFFAERQRQGSVRNGSLIHELRDELRNKLSLLTLRDRVTTPLYFRLDDLPAQVVRVDFEGNDVALLSNVEDENYYSIAAPSWEVARVLDGKITWDDFSLTFRMRLNREPDVYQTLLQGFLRLEAEDMNAFCAKLLDIEENQQRIVVEAGGKRYAVNRFCPHQGGDLSRGWIEEDRFLVCPRHGWRYDLEHDGDSPDNAATVHAVALEDD